MTTTSTPRAALPLLAAAQAQKHVTHNDALLQLDALLFARFLSRNLSTPPATPADGDTYLVKATATGAWTGQNGQIAYASGGVWRFTAPFTGLTAYVVDETKLVVFNGTSFVDYASTLALQNVPLLGVNATADTTNKVAVASSALLFNNIGNGVQIKLNKNAAADTASLLYQTSFSGRAEIGLTGDDNFHFKVSPDGSTFFEGLKLNGVDGSVDFLASESTLASAATCDIGSEKSLNVQITGTTAITSFGSKANKLRILRFAGALTLTHNAASLVLLGAANRITAAGDVGIYTSDASGNWRERDYARAASNPGDFATKSGVETLTNKLLQAQAGSAAAPSHSFSANSNTGLFNPATNVCAVAINGVEAARFDSAGRFLAGVTAPSYAIVFAEFRKDQNAISGKGVTNQNSGSAAQAALVFGAFGNSWVAAVGSSANNGNAFTLATDATATPPTVRFKLTTSGLLQLPGYGAGTATFDASGNVTSVSDPSQKIVLGGYGRGLTDILATANSDFMGLHRWRSESGMETDGIYASFFARDDFPISEAVSKNKDGRNSFSDRPVLMAAVNAIAELHAIGEAHARKIERLVTALDLAIDRIAALQAR
jgi:hypothetical protein